MNYYPHHLGDYAKDTCSLSMLEHGAYRLLLDNYYSTEKPIPQEEIYRAAKAITKADRAAVDYVLRKFFSPVDGAYVQRRAEKEIGLLNAARNRAKDNGRMGGRPKKQNPEETQRVISGFAPGYANETQTEATRGRPKSHEPVLLEKEPKGAAEPLPPPSDVGEEQQRKPKRPSGRALLRAEAIATTAGIVLPKDLDTAEFRAAWADWCQHRERLAATGKPWSNLAATNLLRQCCDNGEAWAIIEIRQALAAGWQGVQWDHRRNPADVRSQPLLPGNNGRKIDHRMDDACPIHSLER